MGAARQVVSLDDGDAQRTQAQAARQRVDAPGSAPRIGRSEVADDADAMRHAAFQDGLQHVGQQRLVAGIGIVASRQLCERQGPLGERLENQEGRTAGGHQGVDHRAGGVGAIAREASCAANA